MKPDYQLYIILGQIIHNALIMLENDLTAIHGILPNSEIQFKMISSIIDCFTKIDKYGLLLFIIDPIFFYLIEHLVFG